MNLPEYSFARAAAPHLRGPQAFEFHFLRETASALLLVLSAAFSVGPDFLAGAAVLAFAAAAVHVLLSAAFRRKICFEISLFREALLLALFLPQSVLPAAACAGALLAFLFFAGGGRQARLMQPVCLTLALFAGITQGIHTRFIFQEVSPWAGGLIFAFWLTIRFPRTLTEAVKFAPLLGMAATLAVLHETPFFFALLWSAAAFDLIFDGTLAPLSKTGAKYHAGAVFILWVLLLAAGERADSLVVTGLTSGFLAAWIERRTMKRNIYGTPLPG